MDDITKKCFSVSELAKLYNISRQTVLYYDKNNLLKPCFRDINGYRYYHFKEYTKLEIILNLRKIGLSISQIRDYIKNPSTAQLNRILENQTIMYNKLISETQEVLKDIEKLKTNIEKTSDEKLEQIYTKRFEEERYYIGPLSSKEMGIKQRMLSLGKSNMQFYRTNHFKYFFNIWMIQPQDYRTGNENNKRFYCIPAELSMTGNQNNILTMPAGLYLCYNFKGMYQPQAQTICSIINKYLDEKHLSLLSPVLVSAQKNFWLTSNKEEYISSLRACIMN